jgi:site-specific DNA recombinase
MKNGRSVSRNVSPDARRCAIYTRKSTSVGLEQDFNSLDAQREACAGYIQRQPGWSLVDDRYDDGGFTGANIERPAFQRLLTDIDAGKIDVVVVYKVDRLSRSLLDFAKLMERFGAAGTSFVSVTQNFSTADAMGRLTLNMLMSFAEFEREMIGERTRDKIAAQRRRGKWTGGSVPLGYSVAGKRLVVNDLEAVLVREVFSLYLQQRSTLAVARLLNESHRSTKRHVAANGRLREARSWTKADVTRVLRNPVYAGYMSSHGELYDGEHEPIVDRETFEQVRELIDGRSGPTKDHSRNADYILRGLLQCARCGSAFTPASTRKGRTEYRYYRCTKRDKEGKEACPSAPLPAGAIEEYVIERLREAVVAGSLASEVEASLKERLRARRKALLIERKRLPGQIAALSAEGKRLLDTLSGVDGVARRLAEERLQGIGDELGRCEARLATVERELAVVDKTDLESSWVASCLNDFTAIWDVLTPENQGRLLRAVVQQVNVDEPSNQVKVFMVDLCAGLPAPVEAERVPA